MRWNSIPSTRSAAAAWRGSTTQHESTRAILAKVSEDPTDESKWTEWQTIWNLIYLNRTDEARAIAEKNGFALSLVDSCEIMLAEGDSAFVATALRRPGWDADVWTKDQGAVLHARMGDREPVFSLIEQYYLDRNPRLWWLMFESFVPASVTTDPRWKQWRERLGFPV